MLVQENEKDKRIPQYRNRLALERIGVKDAVFLEFIEKSIVLGYAEKWGA